jgi:hypothetical protein
MSPAPLLCTYTGVSFDLVGRSQKDADAAYVIGQRYILEAIEERSAASHRHYFASIAEAWANLPEPLVERFASPEMLRKHALMHVGYRDERSIVCTSRAEAKRLAAFVKPIDEYAIITTEGSTVSIWTAKSQSMRAMGKRAFQKSKDDTLTWISALIGVDPKQLESAAA